MNGFVTFIFFIGLAMSIAYLLLSLLWAGAIVTHTRILFLGVLFWSSVGGTLIWLLFPNSNLFYIYEALVLITGIAYCIGKIELLQEQEFFHD